MARREGDYEYEVMQLLNKANRVLRDAEDLSRMERPAWPTADRIRSIHEQITFDVMNGRVNVPPVMQQLSELVEWAS